MDKKRNVFPNFYFTSSTLYHKPKHFVEELELLHVALLALMKKDRETHGDSSSRPTAQLNRKVARK